MSRPSVHSRAKTLRHDRRAPLLGSPIGGLVARPWFDRAALWGLSRWAFPISRAWAAGSIAKGSIERFLEAVPMSRLPAGMEASTQSALTRTESLRQAFGAATEEWEAAFFGPKPVEPVGLNRAYRARRRASHSFMMARLRYLPLRLRTAIPAVRFAIPGPEEVEARYAPLLAEPEAACAPPPTLPGIQESRRIAGPFGTEYWLRFQSPGKAIGDTAWAHVFEPEGVPHPATLVYIDGLGVEIESLDGIVDQCVAALTARGVRVVRLDAPWHAGRRPLGFYGGEPFLAGLPASAIDFLSAVVPDIATLVAWCRSNSAGRVAVGGTSLGALSAQLAACRARAWEPGLRPDALYLATTTDEVTGLAFGSSLARALGLDAALACAGWTAERFRRWGVLWDPSGAPAMRPEDMIMVLGAHDDVTPFERGLALAKRWRLPPENVFLREQGHFSVPLGLIRDPAPLGRLADRLTGAR